MQNLGIPGVESFKSLQKVVRAVKQMNGKFQSSFVSFQLMHIQDHHERYSILVVVWVGTIYKQLLSYCSQACKTCFFPLNMWDQRWWSEILIRNLYRIYDS